MTWKLKSLESALDVSAAKPPWVVKELLLAESPMLVAGQPKCMKSLSWLEAAMEAVAHKTVWGRFAAPDVERTLFIETEDPEWLVESRIRGFAKGLGLKTLPGFSYVCPGPFDLVKHKKELEELFQQQKPHFVVLSTLQNILGGRDWKSQDQMADVMATMVMLARVAPLVVITHSPQDKRQRRAAGSITQEANFGTVCHYLRKKESVNVLVRSKVGSELEGFDLRLQTDSSDPDSPGRVRRITAADQSRGTQAEQVRAYLLRHPGTTAEQVADEIGCSERYVRKIIGLAGANGRNGTSAEQFLESSAGCVAQERNRHM